MVLDAVRELYLLAHAAMSDQEVWPASRNKNTSIWRMLADSGFTEEVTHDTIRYTVRVTPEIELLLACIGAVDPWDVPCFLQEHGYASEEEALEVWEAKSEAEAIRLIRLLVLRAYNKRFVRSALRH